MSSRLVNAALMLAGLVMTAGQAGETKSLPVRRPPLVQSDPASTAPPPERPKEKAKPGLQVDPHFVPLVEGKFSERAAALAAALACAHDLAAPARAEAARLRALTEVERAGHRDMLDWLLGCLDDLVAEEALVRSWKKGLSKEAEAISGRTVDLTCTNSPVADVLSKASKGWGLAFELSPAARRLNSGLEMSLDGAPSLEQFVKWLAAGNELICGHAGGKLVLVPPASVKLAENIEKAAKEKTPTGK